MVKQMVKESIFGPTAKSTMEISKMVGEMDMVEKYIPTEMFKKVFGKMMSGVVFSNSPVKMEKPNTAPGQQVKL